MLAMRARLIFYFIVVGEREKSESAKRESGDQTGGDRDGGA